MRNKIILFITLTLISTTQLLSQQPTDSNSVFYKKSVMFFLSDFAFDGGFASALWLNPNCSFIVGISGYSSLEFKSSTYIKDVINITVYERDIQVSPVMSFRYHVFTTENVTPFIGFTCRPEWHIGEYSKNTQLSYGVIVGVESWLNDHITIVGEHAFIYSQSINYAYANQTKEGRTAFGLALYF
jgi:hypothetical protein